MVYINFEKSLYSITNDSDEWWEILAIYIKLGQVPEQ